MKNKKVLLILILLLCILALVLGYTYSKYSRSYTSKATGAVAKWDFVAGLNSLQTISLADTVTRRTSNSKEGTIAPGTEGEFNIVVDASKSEVDINYEILLAKGEDNLDLEKNKPENLYFLYVKKVSDEETIDIRANSIKELLTDNASEFSGTISGGATKDYKIKWFWPYNTTINGVEQDEADFRASGKNYEFTVNITGTQKLS